MKYDSLIVVTGAAGFIGSCMVSLLNQLGYNNLIVVDEFSRADKMANLEGKLYKLQIHRSEFIAWLSQNGAEVKHIFHLGAKTDTTLQDQALFDELNLNYTKSIWQLCCQYQIELVYASSAATYGDGSYGYDDDESLIPNLHPLNKYGHSKNDFDVWALQQNEKPPHWYGLKFFNVFGPNEYHKSRMASVIFHAYHQMQNVGSVKLFRSHKPEYVDGGQMRDFVYVKDVINVCNWLMQALPNSGIYNLGSGKARSFKDLVTAMFAAMEQTPNIEFVDTPLDIRDSYQYFTEANMNKLLAAGYPNSFATLEDSVKDYVLTYLVTGKYY